jgi:AraC-like DNA-binding protein
LSIRDKYPMIRDVKRSPSRERSSQGPVPGRVVVPRVHLNAFSGLPAVLASFNVPSEPILRTANLTRQDLEDPERSAPFPDVDRLIGLCVRRTKCPHFGLLIGQHANLQSFGIAGRLARHAPSVGAALQDLAAHFVLHDSGGVPSIAIHDDSATLAYGIHTAGVRNADQVYDLSVISMLNIMRQLCGASWKPDAVLLPRKRPTDIHPYREILGAPLRFDAVQCAVIFPAFWLARPVANADPLLHMVLQDRASAELSGQEPMLHGDVHRTIRLLLPSRRCSRADVAQRLGIHPRTLGRRLQESGTTFQSLLDDTRAQMAKQLLLDTRLTVASIAAAIGYGDPTIFTRAFARWTGRTPSAFRAKVVERS